MPLKYYATQIFRKTNLWTKYCKTKVQMCSDMFHKDTFGISTLTHIFWLCLIISRMLLVTLTGQYSWRFHFLLLLPSFCHLKPRNGQRIKPTLTDINILTQPTQYATCTQILQNELVTHIIYINPDAVASIPGY